MVDMQVSLALPSSQAWRMKLTCSRGYKICSLHTRSQCSKCHNTARGKIKHDLKHVGLVNASTNVMTGHEAHFEQSMVCMEYCVLKRADRSVKARDFTKLWPGQYARVLAHEDIFLSMFAQGGGSACKFQYEERTEWKGRPMLVYAHCQERFPRVGVLIHESRPNLVVNQEIVTRDDGLARAVSWHYSASGTRITTKFFYSNVSCQRFGNV